MRCHYILTRMDKHEKKLTKPNTDQETEQSKLLYTVGQSVKQYYHFFLIKLNTPTL